MPARTYQIQKSRENAFPHEGYVTDKEGAAYLKIAVSTFWRWAKENPSLLTPHRFGANTTRWDAEQIRAYPEAVRGIIK